MLSLLFLMISISSGLLFPQYGQFYARRVKDSLDFARNIQFKYYDHNSTHTQSINIGDIANIYSTGCNPYGKFAIIVHGWRESCETEWVQLLVVKLNQYRGGCIMCMDYGSYAYENYYRLTKNFDPIVQVLTLHLYELSQIGFSMDNGYMFGFSFGGQTVSEAGRRIGFQTIRDIDTCDMAGIFFDFRRQVDHTTSAKNVQCIHTSVDKGTSHYNCHQNWRLGNCGITQIAASGPPFGSHGLCPYMYISSFDNDFYAIDKPLECFSKMPATNWPEKYKMGYTEERRSEVRGELFADTGVNYPFNILPSSDNSIPVPKNKTLITDDIINVFEQK